MTLPDLKKHGKDAQAFLDESSGKSSLSDVLAAMAVSGVAIQAQQNTISATILGAVVFPFDVELQELLLHADDWGDGDQTVVDVRSQVGSQFTDEVVVTVPNTQPNFDLVRTKIGKVIPALTPLFLVIEAAPTNGAGFVATLTYSPVKVT